MNCEGKTATSMHTRARPLHSFYSSWYSGSCGSSPKASMLCPVASHCQKGSMKSSILLEAPILSSTFRFSQLDATNKAKLPIRFEESCTTLQPAFTTFLLWRGTAPQIFYNNFFKTPLILRMKSNSTAARAMASSLPVTPRSIDDQFPMNSLSNKIIWMCTQSSKSTSTRMKTFFLWRCRIVKEVVRLFLAAASNYQSWDNNGSSSRADLVQNRNGGYGLQ